MRAPGSAAALAFVLALPAAAHAHGMRTAYVEVTEISAGHAIVHLRVSAPDPSLDFAAPAGCAITPAGDGGSLYDRAWLLDCPGGLRGHELELRGLGPIVSDAVAWIAYADGTTASRLLRPGSAAIPFARPASGAAVARQFVGLGLAHIASGTDHLLFLLLLVLLLRDPRSVLYAETAFTVSHSLSFSATALGWLHVSSAAAETCIALSLVLLAADVRLRGGAPPRWRGALMALLFGFVHGLGFAGGLREIGLPEHAIAAALVGFGAGIELGQVAFLALVLLVLHLARGARGLARVRLAAVYAIGGLSAYWVIARALVCFGGA